MVEESTVDKMILKPLNGFGGSGVILIEKSAMGNINSLLDFLGSKALEQSAGFRRKTDLKRRVNKRGIKLNQYVIQSRWLSRIAFVE